VKLFETLDFLNIVHVLSRLRGNFSPSFLKLFETLDYLNIVYVLSRHRGNFNRATTAQDPIGA
jgi:hypothetical protein